MRIVTLGDSVTFGVRDGVSAEETYSARWGRALVAAGYEVEVISSGVPGENTEGALLRLDEAIVLQPELMTVMYGLNDAAIDAGRFEPRVPLERYEANLGSIVDRLKAAAIEPVLLTSNAMASFGVMEELYGSREPYKSRGINFLIVDFVAAVRRVGAAKGVPVIDVWHAFQLLAEGPGGLVSYLTDGIHPNPAGHEVIAGCLMATPIGKRDVTLQ